MRRSAEVRLLSVLMPAMLAVAALAQVPQRQTAKEPATVEGVVTNALTGEPVPRVHVGFRDWNARPGKYGAFTDARGRFSIKGLPPAEYYLSADRVGFVSIGNRAEDQVTVKPGENKRDLKLKLTPTGAISGRVTGAGGEPMEFVDVKAIEDESVVLSARTDEKGQFRIGGLRPGKYRVRASRDEPPFPPEIRTDGTAETHHVPTYYPSSIVRKSGLRVQVLAGRETSGIEVALVQMPIVCVSGRVSGIPPGTEGVRVSAHTADGYGSEARVRADGSFQLWRPIPGQNTLVSSWYGPDHEEIQSAPVEIEVGAANIENIELAMMPPFDVSGRVEIEHEPGTQSPQPPRPFSRQLTLEPLEPIARMTRTANVAADGSFKLERVPPGRFRLTQNSGREHVGAMRLGDIDIKDGVLDLRYGSGGAELTVFVSTATGEMSGTVRDENGNPAIAVVALIKDEEGGSIRRWPAESATTDRNGAYSLPPVSPGKYKVIITRLSDYRWNLVVRGQLPEDDRDAAEIIEIRANEKLTKDLTLRAQEDQ